MSRPLVAHPALPKHPAFRARVPTPLGAGARPVVRNTWHPPVAQAARVTDPLADDPDTLRWSGVCGTG